MFKQPSCRLRKCISLVSQAAALIDHIQGVMQSAFLRSVQSGTRTTVIQPRSPETQLVYPLSETGVPKGMVIASKAPVINLVVDAYEAAGGQVLRDVFARDDESGVWFEAPVLLEKLATDKPQAAADELATRWKWAVAMIEVAWDDTARYGRIEPQPVEHTPDEQAEIEKLEARQAELGELDDEDPVGAAALRFRDQEGSARNPRRRRRHHGHLGQRVERQRHRAVREVAGERHIEIPRILS